MEKFSAYRDAGTGIQPFLTPVPPVGYETLAKATLPIRYFLGAARTLLILVLFLIYVVLVHGICLILKPIPFLYHKAVYPSTYILGRSILFLVGLFWIPVELVRRKRGKNAKDTENWKPQPGDIIVSNWVSWIELICLAIWFNPTFVLPIPDMRPSSPTSDRTSSHTPGRRTGTGSANIHQPTKSSALRIPIRGFKQVSLLSMIAATGCTPPFTSTRDCNQQSLEEIRKTAPGPVIVFPECTTSNGRGLLRFADVFQRNIPVKGFGVYVMCVRYDPPTTLAPTLSHSIPSNFLNPLAHVFSLTTSLSPAAISIRLLAPSESPSSQLFMVNEVLSGTGEDDQLSEACATLIAQIGKMKRTGKAWEDKANFFEFYSGKHR